MEVELNEKTMPLHGMSIPALFKKFPQIPFWNHKHIFPYSHVYTYENPVCEIISPFGCRSLLGGVGEAVCKSYSLQLSCSLTR